MNFSEDFKSQLQKLLEEFARQLIENIFNEIETKLNQQINSLNGQNCYSNISTKPVDLSVKQTLNSFAKVSNETTQLRQFEKGGAACENDSSSTPKSFSKSSDLVAKTTQQLKALLANCVSAENQPPSITNATTTVSLNVPTNSNLTVNILNENKSSQVSSSSSEVVIAKTPVAFDDNSQQLIRQQKENAKPNSKLATIVENDTTTNVAENLNNETDSSTNISIPPVKKQKLTIESNLTNETASAVSLLSHSLTPEFVFNETQAVNSTEQIITFDQTTELPKGNFNNRKRHRSNAKFANIIVLKLKCSENECNEMFETETDYENHIQTVHKLELFFCLVENCPFRCSNIISLNTHTSQSHKGHGKCNWKCRFCSKQYNKPEDHFEHYELKHQQGIFTCALCKSYTANLLDKVTQHIRKEHFRNINKSNQEKVSLTQENLQTNNLNEHHYKLTYSTKVVPKIINCTVGSCSKPFYHKNNQLDLLRHIEKDHFYSEFKCLFIGCKESYSSEKELENHIALWHDFVKMWKCQHCISYELLSHKELSIHTELEHHKGVFSCAHQDCTFREFTQQKVIMHYNKVHLIDTGINKSAEICEQYEQY